VSYKGVEIQATVTTADCRLTAQFRDILQEKASIAHAQIANNSAVEYLQIVVGELDDFGIFETLNIKISRSLCNKATQITNPSIFNTKSDNMFITIIIQAKSPDFARNNKCIISTYITALRGAGQILILF